jgi:hypothetical protein
MTEAHVGGYLSEIPLRDLEMKVAYERHGEVGAIGPFAHRQCTPEVDPRQGECGEGMLTGASWRDERG